MVAAYLKPRTLEGFGALYDYNKEPQNSIGNYLGPYLYPKSTPGAGVLESEPGSPRKGRFAVPRVGWRFGFRGLGFGFRGFRVLGCRVKGVRIYSGWACDLK